MANLGRTERKKSLSSRSRNYVDFQSKTETPDGEGGFTEVWVNITGATQTPVEILPMREDWKAELRSRNVIATHQINVRHNIPVDEVGRVVWGSRYFYIHSDANLQERDMEHVLVAEERRL